ncbi:hypothetical protein BLNAU_18492 [Blattamonas nauphoetae]|uniref:Protein kinase domain-containing protein n=1 Tax=Blattamonas nauphoetae TaxID=2049346 RepID=A0ABQ9X484_9EUKA|nr:hypothetical protein BLNAU_18492 [Blattamonas nauphoetae]
MTTIPEGIFMGNNVTIVGQTQELRGTKLTRINFEASSRSPERSNSAVPSLEQPCSIISVRNATLGLTTLEFDCTLNEMSSSKNSQFEGTPPIYAALVSSSSVSVTDCTFLVSADSAPFGIVDLSRMDSLPSSLAFIATHLVNKHNHVATFTSILCPFSTSDVSVSISSSFFENTMLTRGEGISIDLNSLSAPRTPQSVFSKQEVALSGMWFSNVSSPFLSYNEKERAKLAGIGLRQRMVGCDVETSNNHLSGSTIRDVNLGGDLLCSNTSFSECQTSTPSLDPPSPIPPTHDPNNYQFVGQKYADGEGRFDQHVPLTEGVIAFSKCSFSKLTDTSESSDTSSSAAAIHIQRAGRTVLISDCSFTDCKSHGLGNEAGAVHVTENFHATVVFPLYLAKSTFLRCSTDKKTGGGLRFHQGDSLILHNCTFDTCSAGSRAGAVDVYQVFTMTLYEVVCRTCSSPRGGGIVLLHNDTATVTSCLFDGCFVAEGGASAGGFYAEGISSLTLTDCPFTECSSVTAGGGIHIISSNTLSLERCTISHSFTSNGEGGGLHVNTLSSGISINNCTIDSCNTTGGNGGGFIINNALTATISNFIVKKCTAVHLDNKFYHGGGGRILYVLNDVTITDSSFTECSIDYYGGGLALSRNDGLTKISNCVFDTCEATAEAGGLYAAMCVAVELKNTTFKHCSTLTKFGGGIRAWTNMTDAPLKFTMNNCTLDDCTTSGTVGGGVAITVFANVSFSQLIAKNCSSAQAGGCVYLDGSSESVSITESSFDNCSAKSGNGGTIGIAPTPPKSSLVTISNTNFEKCSALTGQGGALWLSQLSQIVLTSIRFDECSAFQSGGAVSVDGDSDLIFSFDDQTSFSECSSSSNRGHHLFITVPNITTALTKSNINIFKSQIGALATAKERCLTEGSETNPDGLTASLLYFWYPFVGGVDIHVHSEGEDYSLAGRIEVPLQTLSAAFLKLTVANQQLFVDSSLPLSTELSAKAFDNTILSTNTSAVVGVENGGKITIQHSKLSLSSLSFSSVSSEGSFITVSSSGSLSISSCTFTSFPSSPSGSVISADLDINQILSIDSSSFMSCSATAGAAIIEVEVKQGSLSLTGTITFQTCSTTDAHLVSLKNTNLTTFISSNPLAPIKPTNPADTIYSAAEKQLFWGKEGDMESSLLFYWYPHTTNEVHLQSTGEDHTHCGLPVLPCSSLSTSMTNMKALKTVTIDSPINQSSRLVSSESTWTIKGSTQSPVTFTEDGEILVETEIAHLTLSSLKMLTDALTALRTTPLLAVNNGQLSLDDCVFESRSTTFSIPLLSISGGSATISTSCMIVNPSLSTQILAVSGGNVNVECSLQITHSSTTRTAPLLSLSAGTTTLKGSILSLMSSPTPISINQTAILVLSDGTTSFSTTPSSSLVSMEGGSVQIISSSLTLPSSSSVIKGGGSLSILKASLITEQTTQSMNSVNRAVSITVSSGQQLTIGEEGNAVEFEGWASDGNGGALDVTITGGSVQISHTTFKNCRSAGNGGGICVSCSVSTPSPSLVIKATFTNCVCGVEQKGDWVFVKGSVLSSLIVPPNWAATTTNMLQPDDSKKLWGEDLDAVSSSLSSSTLLVYLVAHTAAEIHQNQASGSETIGCGESSTPCQTLSTAFSRLVSAPTNSITIAESASLNSHLSISFSQLTISGNSDPRKTIEVSSSGRITVQTGKLCLSFLAFTTIETSIPQSLITITDGTSLSITSSSFAKFHTSAAGSVVSGTVAKASSLDIQSTSFTSCSSSSEDGGVIHVVCEDGLESPSLAIDATFTTCSCPAEKRGDWVFVRGHSFPHLIAADFWGNTASSLDTPDDDNLLFGVDLAEEEDEALFRSITLLYYLLPYRNQTIHVGVGGRDSNGCGMDTRLCSLLDVGHSHLSGSGTYSLIINEETELNTKVAFVRNNLVIESEVGQARVVVKGEGCFVDGDFANHHKLSISDLTFDMSSSSCSELFSCGAGELILSSCQFENAGELSCCLVKLVTGDMSIFKTSFSKMSFHTTPFVLDTFGKVKFEDITISNSSCDVLIDATGKLDKSQVDLISCRFSDITPLPSSTNDDSSSLCDWDTGFLYLTNCSTVTQSTSFVRISQGAMKVEGGSLDLTSVLFDGNGISTDNFSSVRKNVMCSSSASIVVTSPQGDGKDELPHWISADDCEVKKSTDALLSPFFVADLSKSDCSSTISKNGSMLLNVVGKTLIPCGLFLEIFDVPSTASSSKYVKLELTQTSAAFEGESSLSLKTTLSTLKDTLDTKHAWRGQLVFGKNQRSAQWMAIKATEDDIRKAQLAEAMKWLIPVLIGVIVFLALITLIIIILVCRRRRNKNKQSLSSQQELDCVNVETKEDILDDNILDHTAAVGHDLQHTGLAATTHSDSLKNPTKTFTMNSSPDETEFVAGVRAERDDAVGVAVKKHNTLYNRLHHPTLAQPIDAKNVRAQIAKGLSRIEREHGYAQILKFFSSHRVMLGQGDLVILQETTSPNLPAAAAPPHTAQSHVNPSLADQTQFSDASQPNFSNASDLHTDIAQQPPTAPRADVQSFHFSQSQQKTEDQLQLSSFDGVRWMAPECVTTDGKLSSTIVNPGKAAVFSLGLVLFEIESGQVPFGEIDALNAHRQLSSGCMPRMELVHDSTMKDLIEQCLCLLPKDRPTLSEVSKILEKMNQDDHSRHTGQNNIITNQPGLLPLDL